MELSIISSVRIDNHSFVKDGKETIFDDETKVLATPEEFYRYKEYNYMKFFKMDLLCKWAWLGTEVLLEENDSIISEIDKSNIAVVLMTHHGCIDVDKKYLKTTESIPSPALFVYTLPNIMLGEICIRHGFKGEQASLVSDRFDIEEIHYYVSDLLNNRGMKACLFGWVDAFDDSKDVALYWVSKSDIGNSFTVDNIKEIYSKD